MQVCIGYNLPGIKNFCVGICKDISSVISFVKNIFWKNQNASKEKPVLETFFSNVANVCLTTFLKGDSTMGAWAKDLIDCNNFTNNYRFCRAVQSQLSESSWAILLSLWQYLPNPIVLKSDSDLPKFYLLQLKTLKNDEKCYLFRGKCFFCSSVIYILFWLFG